MYEVQGNSRVTVTDVDMPFWSMVRFMLKWAIAAIPAVVILGAVGLILSVIATIALGVIGAGLR